MENLAEGSMLQAGGMTTSPTPEQRTQTESSTRTFDPIRDV
jgi:hypothetical protein